MLDSPVTPKFTRKDEILPLALLVSTWGLAALFWPHLPARVPTHWGLDGKPNGWMPMPWGAIVLPLIATLMYLLLTAIPFIDPRRAHWGTTMRVYPVIKNVIQAFMAGITYLALSAALRPDHRLWHQGISVAMGLMLVVIGNYLPKVRSNFFVGVRTPWTLSSDVVWVKTNRLVGWMMIVGGLAVMATSPLPAYWSLSAILVLTALLAVVSLVYSWWLYSQLGPSPR